MEYQHYYVNDELHKHIWTQIHVVRTHTWISVHRKFGRRQSHHWGGCEIVF